MANSNVKIAPLLTVNFIGMLGYSIIMPFLVFLVSDFGGNEFIYGLMGSVYPAFQLVGAPLLGKWSDTVGRKKILLVSQIGTFLAWLIFLLALNSPSKNILSIDSTTLGTFTITVPLLVLFLARALDGITGGNVSVANAYLSDISTDENRKANFGKMAMSSSLGFILGPMLAGLLGSTKYKEAIPVVCAAIISLVAIWLIQFYLPESKAQPVDPTHKQRFRLKKLFGVENKECYEMKKKEEPGLAAVFKIKYIPFMLFIYFLVFLGFSFFYAGFPMFALKQIGWDSFQLGIFFSVLSGLMVLVQGPLLTYFSKRIKDEPLVILGSALLIINFILMSTGNVLFIYSAAILFALGNGLMWPSFLSILSKMGGEKQQGSVQGIANSTGSLASIIGLILGGYLFGVIGSYSFLVTAGFLAVIFVLSFRLLQIKMKGSEEAIG